MSMTTMTKIYHFAIAPMATRRTLHFGGGYCVRFEIGTACTTHGNYGGIEGLAIGQEESVNGGLARQYHDEYIKKNKAEMHWMASLVTQEEAIATITNPHASIRNTFELYPQINYQIN